MFGLVLHLGCLRASSATETLGSLPTVNENTLCSVLVPKFVSDLPGTSLVASGSDHLLLYSIDVPPIREEGPVLSTCVGEGDRLRFTTGDVEQLGCTGWTLDDGLLIKSMGGWTDGESASLEAWYLVPAGTTLGGELRLKVHTVRYQYRSSPSGQWEFESRVDVSEGREQRLRCPDQQPVDTTLKTGQGGPRTE